MGAMLNVQLDRLDGDDRGDARGETRDPRRAPRPSTISDCGRRRCTVPITIARRRSCIPCRRPRPPSASPRLCPSVIAGKTGRHTYTEWDQVLVGAGAAHPAMNPYNMPANARVPEDLFTRHVRKVARHPEPHGDGGDPSETQRSGKSPTSFTTSAWQPGWFLAGFARRRPICARLAGRRAEVRYHDRSARRRGAPGDGPRPTWRRCAAGPQGRAADRPRRRTAAGKP